MANLQGYTRSAVGNMLNHYTRHDGDPNQERYRYQNQTIDSSRTHLNYALLDRPDPKGFIDERVASAGSSPRKTTNVLSDWAVTLPKSERLAGREAEFFEETFEYLSELVGRDNVVGAYVHLDETSPHMHFCFVPVVETTKTTNDKSQPLRWTKRDEARNPAHKAGEVKRDRKGTIRYKRVVARDADGKPIVSRTVSQSKMFDRQAMLEFHPKLSAHLKDHFGFDVGVELEDEGDRVLSRLNHDEYVAAKTTLKRTERDVSRLAAKRDAVSSDVAVETDRLERLQEARVDASERVEVLESVASECDAAGDAPLGRLREIFDRIVALCTRFLERLGVRVRSSDDRPQGGLTIGVRGGAPVGGMTPTVTRAPPIVVPGPSLAPQPQRQLSL